jgi:hypothetical protein
VAEDSKGSRSTPASPDGRTALVTGGLAAILASTCCLGPGEAIVTFDNAKTNVNALTEATKNAGYPSTPVKGASQ